MLFALITPWHMDSLSTTKCSVPSTSSSFRVALAWPRWVINPINITQHGAACHEGESRDADDAGAVAGYEKRLFGEVRIVKHDNALTKR